MVSDEVLDPEKIAEAQWLRGFVWQCGDPECDCSQAVIMSILDRDEAGWFLRARALWFGPYRMAAFDKAGAAYADLGLARLYLERREPALAGRITWQ